MRALLFAAAMALVTTTGMQAALAHARMVASVPTDGASVASPVSAIEFSFSKPLRLTLVKVVRKSDQKQMPMAGELPKSFGTSAKTPVAPLSAGSYEVAWTAVAEDGHVMKGSFAFTVDDARGSDAKP